MLLITADRSPLLDLLTSTRRSSGGAANAAPTANEFLLLGVSLAGVVVVVLAGTEFWARRWKRAHEASLVLEKVEATLESQQQAQIPTEDRLRAMGALLDEAATELERARRETEQHAADVARYRAEAADAQRLAEITKEQREAVAQVLRGELRDELQIAGRKSARHAITMNIVFFVAGAIVSFVLQLWLG